MHFALSSPTLLVGDDEGQAALEGVLAAMVLAGVFIACFLLTQWSAGLQTARMGGRLLAFNAGDSALAQVGRPTNLPTQQFASNSWSPTFGLDSLFTPLLDSSISGSVTGTAHGKLPGQSSLVAYAPAALGYYAGNWAGFDDPWQKSDTASQRMFARIAYNAGYHQLAPALKASNGKDSLKMTGSASTILDSLCRFVGE